MNQKTATAANGKWYGILRHFGVDESFLRNVHGPCPICGGVDRFRWDDKGGDGTYYCNSCGPGDGFKLLMEVNHWDFATCAAKVDEVVSNVTKVEQPKKKDPLPRLKQISKKSISPMRTPVEKYLDGRGLTLCGVVERAISYHSEMPYYHEGRFQGKHPAMIAKVSDPAGHSATYHVTYLTPGGQKADVQKAKKIMPPARDFMGGAVRLYELLGDHLGVAEGIENAITCSAMYNIPCWAALSSKGLEKFVPPEGVKYLTIFGDRDSSYAGQAAAYALAFRLANGKSKLNVEVIMPPQYDIDFNDIQMEELSNANAVES